MSDGAESSTQAVEEQTSLRVEIERLDKEWRMIIDKIQDLKQDILEHKLVLDVFDKAPDDRRCFRLVGGVLVERTVKEVRPALQTHKTMVERMVGKLEIELENVKKEYATLMEKSHVQFQPKESQPADATVAA